MQEALGIEKDVKRCWELLYPAHLLNFSHGELGCSPILYCKTSKKQIPGKKTPKAHLCALGGVSRSHKDHRRHQRAIGTQLLWGFVAAAAAEHSHSRPWLGAASGLPLCWAGAGAVLSRPSEPHNETAGLIHSRPYSSVQSPYKTPIGRLGGNLSWSAW